MHMGCLGPVLIRIGAISEDALLKAARAQNCRTLREDGLLGVTSVKEVLRVTGATNDDICNSPLICHFQILFQFSGIHADFQLFTFHFQLFTPSDQSRQFINYVLQFFCVGHYFL